MFFYLARFLSLFCLAFLHLNAAPKTPAFPTNDPLEKLGIKDISKKTPLQISPLVKPLVILDPGHGGRDVGTQSISKPRYQEKHLNLTTAQFVKTFLLQQGYQVWMTREEDVFVSLEKRATLANQRNPVIFVSIHYNSAPSAEANGIEVFYYQSKENKERTDKSKRLAQIILKNALSQTRANSRGIKAGNYAVIRETTMPAVLIEGGFVTNEAELQKLKDPLYLKKIAWGITQGINEYLKPVTKSKSSVISKQKGK